MSIAERRGVLTLILTLTLVRARASTRRIVDQPVQLRGAARGRLSPGSIESLLQPRRGVPRANCFMGFASSPCVCLSPRGLACSGKWCVRG